MAWARTADGYPHYLASPHWHERRRRAFGLAGGICIGCERKAEHIHHRTYARLGQERDEDLVAVCHDCHRDIHLLYVEYADNGLAWATDNLLRQRREMWSLPPIEFPWETAVVPRQGGARGDRRREYHMQRNIDSPVRMAIRAAVKCRNCDAKPGEFCTSSSGKPRAQCHISRQNTYLKAHPLPDGSLTEADIEAGRSERGGWTREQLALWGVPYPPPKGWKARLAGDAHA
jgi:hypothetical protein